MGCVIYVGVQQFILIGVLQIKLVDVLGFMLIGVSIGDVLYGTERMLMCVGVVIGDVLCVVVISVVLRVIFSEIFRKKKKTIISSSTEKIISYIFRNLKKPEEHKVK